MPVGAGESPSREGRSQNGKPSTLSLNFHGVTTKSISLLSYRQILLSGVTPF
jgi:hypothetical protein